MMVRGDGDIKRHRGVHVHHEKAGHRENIPVGEVDQPQDAVDHGVADGDQGILPAHRNPCQNVGEKPFKPVQITFLPDFHEGVLRCHQRSTPIGQCKDYLMVVVVTKM